MNILDKFAEWISNTNKKLTLNLYSLDIIEIAGYNLINYLRPSMTTSIDVNKIDQKDITFPKDIKYLKINCANSGSMTLFDTRYIPIHYIHVDNSYIKDGTLHIPTEDVDSFTVQLRMINKTVTLNFTKSES